MTTERESAVGQSNRVAAPHVTRRDLMTLLGLLGGAAALGALAGCRGGVAQNAPHGPTSGPLGRSATTLTVAQTVLGAAPPNTRTGDLATNNNVSLVTGQTTSAVVVEGCIAPGDGGGGLFWWSSDTATPDDGGTVIVPCVNGARTGCWKRIYSGPLDVRWFGAKGNGVAADDGPIQAALNAAAQLGTADPINAGANGGLGGVVYMPAGCYALFNTLVVKGQNVTLRGAGAFATTLQPQSASVSPAIRGHSKQSYYCRLESFCVIFPANINISPTTYKTRMVGCDFTAFDSSTAEDVAVGNYGGTGVIGFLVNAPTSGRSAIPTGYYNRFINCRVGGGGSGSCSVGFWFTTEGSPATVNANCIIGGHVDKCDYAVWLDSCYGCSVYALTSESIYLAHYQFGSTFSGYHASFYNIVETPYCEGPSQGSGGPAGYVAQFASSTVSDWNYVRVGSTSNLAPDGIGLPGLVRPIHGLDLSHNRVEQAGRPHE